MHTASTWALENPEAIVMAVSEKPKQLSRTKIDWTRQEANQWYNIEICQTSGLLGRTMWAINWSKSPPWGLMDRLRGLNHCLGWLHWNLLMKFETARLALAPTKTQKSIPWKSGLGKVSHLLNYKAWVWFVRLFGTIPVVDLNRNVWILARHQIRSFRFDGTVCMRSGMSMSRSKMSKPSTFYPFNMQQVAPFNCVLLWFAQCR